MTEIFRILMQSDGGWIVVVIALFVTAALVDSVVGRLTKTIQVIFQGYPPEYVNESESEDEDDDDSDDREAA